MISFSPSLFYTIFCEPAEEIQVYVMWKMSIVYWINTIVVPCLHYFGAYELMDHNSTARGTAQAE